MAETAKVYLVGAGPGDPDLLTRKAERLLHTAEAVIYDRLVGTELLELVNPNARLIYVDRMENDSEEAQAEVYSWYLRLRNAKGPVVRLKNGDPLVFSRGGEELEFLSRHGFEIEIVPGISSVTSAPTLSGIPLTMPGVADTFTVIAGHTDCLHSVDWLVYRHISTIVILIGDESPSTIAANLIHAGRSREEPVAVIERCSTRWEKVREGTLGTVAKGLYQTDSPAVLVIGDVVQLRKNAGTPLGAGVFGLAPYPVHKAS